MKNISTKQLFQMTFWVLLSAITQAFALTSFSVPAGIYPSGVSGLSRLLSDILKTFMNYDLPYFYLYLIINIVLVLVIAAILGPSTRNAIIAIAVSTTPSAARLIRANILTVRGKEFVEAARAMGLKKVVVTHPEWWIVDMSLEDQLRMVKDYDVLLERCFAQNMGGGKYKSNLPDNLEVIRTVGYKNVMISTDGGQTENPNWEIAYEQYMQYMADHGVPEDQLRYMTHTIQTGLLNLKD